MSQEKNVDPATTADGRPNPLRFTPEDPSARTRIAVGSWMLTGATAWLYGALGTIGSRPLVHRAERRWARAAARLLRLDITISGLDHIEPDTEYVVASLHEGFADAIALMHLPLGLRFTARDELYEWPALGRYLTATDQIKVDGDPSVSTLREFYRQIGTALDSGDSLVVFPQGSILGIEIAFWPGLMRIARRFSRPILPVVLTGSHRVWEHPFSSTVRLDQKMTMRILDPLPPEEINARSIRVLEQTMKRIAHDSEVTPRCFVPERDGWWDEYRYEIDPDYPELAHRVADHRRRDPDH